MLSAAQLSALGQTLGAADGAIADMGPAVSAWTRRPAPTSAGLSMHTVTTTTTTLMPIATDWRSGGPFSAPPPYAGADSATAAASTAADQVDADDDGARASEPAAASVDIEVQDPALGGEVNPSDPGVSDSAADAAPRAAQDPASDAGRAPALAGATACGERLVLETDRVTMLHRILVFLQEAGEPHEPRQLVFMPTGLHVAVACAAEGRYHVLSLPSFFWARYYCREPFTAPLELGGESGLAASLDRVIKVHGGKGARLVDAPDNSLRLSGLFDDRRFCECTHVLVEPARGQTYLPPLLPAAYARYPFIIIASTEWLNSLLKANHERAEIEFAFCGATRRLEFVSMVKGRPVREGCEVPLEHILPNPFFADAADQRVVYATAPLGSATDRVPPTVRLPRAEKDGDSRLSRFVYSARFATRSLWTAVKRDKIASHTRIFIESGLPLVLQFELQRDPFHSVLCSRIETWVKPLRATQGSVAAGAGMAGAAAGMVGAAAGMPPGPEPRAALDVERECERIAQRMMQMRPRFGGASATMNLVPSALQALKADPDAPARDLDMDTDDRAERAAHLADARVSDRLRHRIADATAGAVAADLGDWPAPVRATAASSAVAGATATAAAAADRRRGRSAVKVTIADEDDADADVDANIEAHTAPAFVRARVRVRAVLAVPAVPSTPATPATPRSTNSSPCSSPESPDVRPIPSASDSSPSSPMSPVRH